MSTLQAILDSGDINAFFAAAKATKLGTRLKELFVGIKGSAGAVQVSGGEQIRIVREQVVVATNAAVTTNKVHAVLAATWLHASTRTRLTPVSNLVTLAATQVKGTDSSGVGTAAIALYASEVADGDIVDVTYLTLDVPALPTGAIAITTDVPGVFAP